MRRTKFEIWQQKYNPFYFSEDGNSFVPLSQVEDIDEMRYEIPVRSEHRTNIQNIEFDKGVSEERIFTVINGDDGNQYIVDGCAFANRESYIITKNPCDKEHCIKL